MQAALQVAVQCRVDELIALVPYTASCGTRYLYETKSVTQQREHSLELQIPQLVAPPAEPALHAAQIQRVERGHLALRQLKIQSDVRRDA